MRTILLAVLVTSAALLIGCTDDLAMDQRDIEMQPLDPTSAARRPELAAQSNDPARSDQAARGLAADADGETDAVPCPTPAPGFSPHDAVAKQEVLDEAPADYCAELPSDGPCSLACDPDAMIDQYVPHGQCVTYRCELKSGQVFRTGGCNP